MRLSNYAPISTFLASLLVTGCASNSQIATPQTKPEIRAQKSDETIALSKMKNKNELLSAILKLALSGYLESNGYGQMSDFAIDTEHKTFVFSLDLKGETKPLKVAVSRYDVLRENGKSFFVIRNLATDKEWLNIVAKQFLQERKIEIPYKYSIFLQFIA